MDRILSESLPETHEVDDLATKLDIQGTVDFTADAVTKASNDFGGIYHLKPVAVIRPATARDISKIILTANESSTLTVAARGNGHSINGQAMTDTGFVIEMSALEKMMQVVRNGTDAFVDVSSGMLWEDLLSETDRTGLLPRSWTDYLALTVGGTLSVGGVSGQAFRFGPQTSNVSELEVVTGTGDTVLCSETMNSELFFSVLGGLGQFGIITRARILLQPAPKTVRWIRVVYTEFRDFKRDAEFLVTRPEGDSFDYVEGFAFINSDHPGDGWPSIPLDSKERVNPDSIPSNSGQVLYCLEVVFHYRRDDDSDTVDEVVSEMFRPLRFVPELRFSVDMEYTDFLQRVKRVEQATKRIGLWDVPHPWLNLFISERNVSDFDRLIFKKILCNGIGGPMLVYPLLKSKWDSRTSVVLPESEIFYLVALLRSDLSVLGGPSLEQIQTQNEEIIQCCIDHGFDFKLYIPHFQSEEQWKQHFGDKWSRFVDRKTRFDPMAILAPAQRIFPRVYPTK